MNVAFWFSYAALWTLVVILTLLVLLLYRQFGLTYMSGQRRINMQGLDVGARARNFSLLGAGGEPHRVSWSEQHQPSWRLIVFGAPTCAVCERLSLDVAVLPDEWPEVDFVWVDRRDGRDLGRLIDGPAGWLHGVAPDDAVHREWDVSAVPFAFVVSSDGEIVRKQLVNTGEDIQELLEVVPRFTAMPPTAEVFND
jgi:hypothetical protein